MFISPISFGAKVPIGKCKIKDRWTDKNVSANIYEYECNDLSDIISFDLRYNSSFSNLIKYDMKDKYHRVKNGGNYNFYTVEVKNKIVGAVETEKKDGAIAINYIASCKSYNYGNVGTTLLNLVGDKAIEEKKDYEIYMPLLCAIPFYAKYGFYPKDPEEEYPQSLTIDNSTLKTRVKRAKDNRSINIKK